MKPPGLRLTRPVRLAACAVLLPLAVACQRPIDGTGTIPIFPDRGAADTELGRALAAAYADGLGTPSGASRPSARAVSNAVSAQVGSVPNSLGVSDFVWQWGQFVDHDIDLSPAPGDPVEPLDIPVPLGDPFFDPFSTGIEVIGFERSDFLLDGGGVRQQINAITAWVDGSGVYGSDPVRAAALRANDGTGKLAVSAHATGDLLPFNTAGLPNAPSSAPNFFLGGDIRANEQIGLTAMHTLFVREHNRLCDQLAALIPSQPGDHYYEWARALVWGMIQKITYDEFLPALLGPSPLPPYTGWKSLDPTIVNVFSTAAYRFGHSMLSGTLLRLDSGLSEIADGHIALRDAFFDPTRITDEGGIDPILRGLSQQVAQEIDTLIVDDVRNFLFGPPGAGGFDLGALNIQRGRDHGLPDYNSVRVAYGLPAVTTFAEITSDVTLQGSLAATYGSVDDIDPWVGGLAEDHLPGALVGETNGAILTDQFLRLRDSDRFWYQRVLVPGAVAFVDAQTLSDVIVRNTGIGAELQADVFQAP